MPKSLIAVPELCTGCQRCVYACAAAKEGAFIPSRARIHVNNFPVRGFSAPSICFQCPNAECMRACPEKAIYTDDRGLVLVDASKCQGHGACADACPYGMIVVSNAGLAQKCDHCGGDPACVRECHFDALIYAEADAAQKKAKALQMKHRQQAANPELKRHGLGKELLAEARG